MKLHLACGKRYIPGFVHVDLADFPHVDHRSPIDRLPMFADASADLIYCCHGLEYFDRAEARLALAEWRRVLKDGGLLRVAVPDLEALLDVYRTSGSLDAILGPLYGRMAIHTTDVDAVIYHRTVYDYRSLEAICLASGFHSVRRYDWRETLHRDYDDFSQAYWPHMDREHGVHVSLNVEARK